MLQKLMKNENSEQGASLEQGLGGTNPITWRHQLPSGKGEGADEGLYLESAPLEFSEADLCFAIFDYFNR